jgi:hypothetical protein
MPAGEVWSGGLQSAYICMVCLLGQRRRLKKVPKTKSEPGDRGIRLFSFIAIIEGASVGNALLAKLSQGSKVLSVLLTLRSQAISSSIS